MANYTMMALGLYFLGAFALIAAFLLIPAAQAYVGGAFVGLFIAGLLYAWANTMRQGTKMVKETQPPPPSAQVSQPQMQPQAPEQKEEEQARQPQPQQQDQGEQRRTELQDQKEAPSSSTE